MDVQGEKAFFSWGAEIRHAVKVTATGNADSWEGCIEAGRKALDTLKQTFPNPRSNDWWDHPAGAHTSIATRSPPLRQRAAGYILQPTQTKASMHLFKVGEDNGPVTLASYDTHEER